MTLYIGLMSGTSMDGIDAVLVDIHGNSVKFLSAHQHPWSDALTARLRNAAEHYQDLGLTEYGHLDSLCGIQFAEASMELLAASGIDAGHVRAIGSHGQTLLHRPRGADGFTLQIGDPNIIAERTGIDVVADFRRRDVAAGGEGAPLMPAFHAAVFAAAGETRAVVNIGGMANVTLLSADGGVAGFDTGPGNCLLDAWTRRHRGDAFDQDGRWAAMGRIHDGLLQQLLAEPYFTLRPPKSTGRDAFSDDWLEARLARLGPIAPADVQTTLAELTARTIADAIGPVSAVFVCGGGAFNSDLLARLRGALPGARIESTAALGLAPQHVEASGFAWLAHRYLEALPGNLPAVTGARHQAALGGLYRGRCAGSIGEQGT